MFTLGNSPTASAVLRATGDWRTSDPQVGKDFGQCGGSVGMGKEAIPGDMALGEEALGFTASTFSYRLCGFFLILERIM